MGLGTLAEGAPELHAQVWPPGRLGRRGDSPSAGRAEGEPSSPNRLASERQEGLPLGAHSSPGTRPPPGAPRGLRLDPPMPPWGLAHTAWPAREWEWRQAGSRKPPSHVGKQHRCQLFKATLVMTGAMGWPLPDVAGRQPPAGAATGAPFRVLETQACLASSYPGHQLGDGRASESHQVPKHRAWGLLLANQTSFEHPEQGLNPSSAFSHHMTGKLMVHSLGFLICETGTKQSACDPVGLCCACHTESTY